ERTPGRIRGALPNVLAADVENAAGFRYKLSLVFARMRSVRSPGTRNGWPETTFGRAVPPYRKIVPFTFWLTPMGNPLWMVITGETIHPPRIALPRRLPDNHLLPSPNGRLKSGLITSLCGESSRLLPYSASGL